MASPVQEADIQEGFSIPEAEGLVEGETSPFSHDAQLKKQKQASYHVMIYVSSGFHEGASFELKETLTIGSDFENDIILTDEGIQPAHAKLSVVQTKFGHAVQVETIAGEVFVNHKTAVATGIPYAAEDNFHLTIGTVTLKAIITTQKAVTVAYHKFVEPKIDIFRHTIAEKKEQYSPKKIFADKKNIIIAVLAGLFLSLCSGLIYYSIPEEPVLAPIAIEVPDSTKTYIPTVNTNDLKRAANDLIYALKEYGLNYRLQVGIYEETIYVQGEVNPLENEAWEKVNSWFDANYAAESPMISLVKVVSEQQRHISFKAVYTGKNPFVVSWTGERYTIGSILPEGWMVVDIKDSGVILTSQGRTQVVQHHTAYVGGYKR